MFWMFLQNSIRYSTMFLFGATGEIITEKSGHLNLGIPGTMSIGAVGGAVGARIYLDSLSDISQINGFSAVLVPVIFAMLFAGLAGLLFSFLTVTLRCNQNITGLSITTFGVGFISYYLNKIDQTDFTTLSTYFI